MDLSHEEINSIKRRNQGVKAVGNGSVVITWKDGKIERIVATAEVTSDIYKAGSLDHPLKSQEVEVSD